MRAIGLTYAAVVTLGAHCQHTPWAYAPEPAQAPGPQVYFDSGAVVRAYLTDGDVVTGPLLVSFAPEGRHLVVCEDRRGPCESPDAAGARTLPLTAIERLKVPYPGTSIGADVGFRLGGLVALGQDDEDTGRFMLGMLAGAVVGGAIGSQVTRWITVAERSDFGRLNWIPEAPVLIPLPPAGYHFTTVCVRGDSPPTGSLVAVVRTTGAAFYTDIRQVWDVDSGARRIIPSRTEGVRCRNASWTTPLPVATHALEGAALTFTPSRGKARIYVYQAEGRSMDRPIEFAIAIDSQTVGRTGHGTFVMVEVEPGPHRVSSPGEDKSVVSLEAAADSVYFVKIWHKVGIRRPKLGGLKRVDAKEGRTLIPTAQMVRSARP